MLKRIKIWSLDSMGSAANPQSPIHNVFVYGSLLSDDVVRVLLNRIPASSSATLPNYHRFSIRGRVYPAILPVENNKVIGKVLRGITPPELHILDEFEDVEYERRTVDVFLMGSSEKLEAYTYVWENKNDPDLFGEWDFETWNRLHKEDFLKMSADFVKEVDSKSRVETYESFYRQTDNNPSNP